MRALRRGLTIAVVAGVLGVSASASAEPSKDVSYKPEKSFASWPAPPTSAAKAPGAGDATVLRGSQGGLQPAPSAAPTGRTFQLDYPASQR